MLNLRRLASIATLAALSLSQRALANPCPQLLFYTPINVDATTGNASTTLQIQNPLPQSAKYSLTISDFKSKNTQQGNESSAVFYGSDGKAVGPLLLGMLPANSDPVSLRVDFSHIVEAGESDAELQCDGAPISPLRAVKLLGLPFKTMLEGNPPEKPILEFVNGTKTDIFIKNDDSVTYPVRWEVTLKNITVGDTALLLPNTITKISVAPNGGWFSRLNSLFRDEIVDGRFTLEYSGDSGQHSTGSPSRSGPISGHLSFYSYGSRDFVSVTTILLFLALGGLTSSYINVDLVNRIRQIVLNRRLNRLARVLGDIAPQLGSRLRVALLLERKRIIATLPKDIFFTPETAGILTQCGTDTDSLETRLNLAVQISDARSRQGQALDQNDPAPSLMEGVDRNLLQAEQLLGRSLPTPAEIQKSQSLIGDAVAILDNLDSPDPNLEQTLTSNLQSLKANFIGPVLADPICAAIRGQVPIPFSLLTAVNPGLATQSERDGNIRRLQIIWDLVQLQNADPETIKNLQPQSLSSLRLAEQRVRELKDRILPTNFATAISSNPPAFSLLIDRDVVRVNQAVMMRVVFNDPLYARSAARRVIECTWTFGHSIFKETGWEINHYFPSIGPYPVQVAFKDEKKNAIPLGAPVVLNVNVVDEPTAGRSQTIVEVQRWAVGFLVAIITLFAGAKDKILTLDTLNAIFAVFLLGFSIDVAKNLLASKTS